MFAQDIEAAILVAQLQEEMSINMATIVNIMEGMVAVDGLIITIIGIEGATMERMLIQKTIGQVKFDSICINASLAVFPRICLYFYKYALILT